jgi:hypothetical protein
LLNGTDRRALQTQFPTSSIELWGCDQLDLRCFHDAVQETSQMLAPARLLELIRDPRIIAAVTNATTAPMNGMSAANQNVVLMLFISSIRRPRFHKKLNFSNGHFFENQRSSPRRILTVIPHPPAADGKRKVPTGAALIHLKQSQKTPRPAARTNTTVSTA